MMRRTLSMLGSLRMSIGLIIVLSVIFLLGLWIPQKGLLKRDLYLQWKAASPGLVSFLETLGLTDIYLSPVTLILWALFFMNLSLVMWRRVKVIRGAASFVETRIEDPVTTAAYPHKTSFALPAGAQTNAILESLGRQRYRLYGQPMRFYAVRNRFAPYATLLFHLSFFLMLVGGVVSVYTKFEGTVDLAEGEEFSGEIERYNDMPRLPKVGGPPKVHLTLERIQPEVASGQPTGIRAIFREAGGRQVPAEVNRPYESGATSLVIKDLGVAPLFVIRDKEGRELDGAYVKLNVLLGREDGFQMAGLDVAARFFPDYAMKNGVESSHSKEFRNPVFSLRVREGRSMIGRGTVRPGEAVNIGKYRLELPELRYWVRFYVVKDHGSGIVYAGFALATAALIWRLIFFRREIVGSVVPGPEGLALNLAGRAEFYRTLFDDEFRRLAERLRQAVR
ncbi:MAG: hypothetical protein OHK006_06280 [Thermodesulfovibrionales bacterium]